MTDDEFNEYLKFRYNPELEWYKNHAEPQKRVYYVFQWGLVLLSALTPILVTLGEFGITKDSSKGWRKPHVQICMWGAG